MIPITALIGPNEVYKREYLKKELRKIPPDEISTYFADEVEPGVIFAQCSQDSLFGSSNIVVVKNIDAMKDRVRKDFEEALEKYLAHVNPSAVLFLLAEKFNADLTSRIRDNGQVFEFKKPYRNELLKYVTEKLEDASIQFDRELPDFLVTITNEDGEQIEMMVELILNYAYKSKNITLEDAKQLLSRSHNMDIFDFLEGLFQRDKKKALSALNDLRLTGDPVTKITYMILRSAKNLWGYLALKNKADASSVLKIKPFEVKVMSEYSRYSDMKFVSSVLELARSVEVKTKSMGEEFVYLELENFILSSAR